TTTGNYYIGFKGHSDMDMFYLYLDSFSVTEFTEMIDPPTDLTATVVNNNNVHLAWTAPANRQSIPVVASVTGSGSRNVGTAVYTPNQPTNNNRDLLGYKVYRDNVLISTITGAATVTYDDMALAIGEYSYTVTAFYDGGESTPAGPATASIVPALNPPTDLASVVDGNDVTLTWTSPEAPQPGEWITWCNNVLGNSIGTGGAFNFDVAHRYAVSDLTEHVGGTITQVKFVPSEVNSTYTVKIWTGGSATSAGTLVSSQLITAPVIDEWNLVVLNTPVQIPANSEMYIGFNCNAQTGHPAGCDNGPPIAGKGNMIYSDGEWAQLTALEPTLTCNWLIQAFVADGVALKAMELKPIAENHIANPKTSEAVFVQNPNATIRRSNRAITGFKVFRDNVQIAAINDPAITTYTENDLPNATYIYGVSAVYSTGESVQATTSVTVNLQLAPAFFTDGFETYDNFALLFAPWTLLDADHSATWGIQDVAFPGSEGPMAYIIFNPSATTPAITSVAAHGGAKMAASFASTVPPNNDWMITPRVNLGTESAVKFYARSMNTTYLEDFRLGISDMPNITQQGFQYVTGANPVTVSATWTEYIYDLSAYDGQTVYLGIHCVSNNKFIFFVDDFSIHSVGGSVGNEDGLAPVLFTELKGNYPNPFNPETTISFSVNDITPVTIEVFNVKGQKVKTLVNDSKAAGNHTVVWKGMDDNNRAVGSGVYFFKMSAGKYSSTKKMIMMK
ncbi:MAG: choice-of-anchor J domain-containing protein, partial [Candidatus Cloacimonetes bacterium]|nr:choice-of-anchor J domain-containing protein [Candidatus Cloacimonadota bacterium]